MQLGHWEQVGVTAGLGRGVQGTGRGFGGTDECWEHCTGVEAVGLGRKQGWKLAERAAG